MNEFAEMMKGLWNNQNLTFINKPCVSVGVCEHDKNVVLDKIRAEIKHHSEHFINDDGDDCLAVYEDDVFDILDKYKAESEEK